MDPFESLPEEVHDLILQFFEVREVLDVLSLVSKSWYEATASSNVCMRKVNLNLRAKRKTNFADRIEVLKWMSRSTGRKYQHLQINCLLDEAISAEVWIFLEAVQDSVETINIRSMKLDQTLKEISLPKLEELKMMFVPRDPMNLLLDSSSSLKKLILRNEFSLCYDGVDYTPTEATLHSIKECVRRNHKLEELEMQGRAHFLSFFQENLTEVITFQLKKLIVKIEISAEKILATNEENLLKVLVQQAHSLEHVYVDSCGTKVIQQVFNEMPAVKFIRFDVELREPNKFVIKDLNLSPNEKVTQLELPYILLFDDDKEFLQLVPNVEEILIDHMSPMLLEFAGKSLLKLKSIVYRYDDCTGGCDLAYENLRRENPELNQSIKLSICNDFM